MPRSQGEAIVRGGRAARPGRAARGGGRPAPQRTEHCRRGGAQRPPGHRRRRSRYLSALGASLAVFAALLTVLFAINDGDEGTGPAGTADPGPVSGDAVADFQRAVRADPGSAPAYAGLGEAYLARAREGGDPGLYSRAERAFDAALRRDPGELGALIGAGNLAGLRHDFAEQLRLGRRAVALAPGLARPYTVVADAQIELGRYGAAAESIQRLLDLKPSLAGYARASYYRELTGDLAGAVAAMRLAASAGGSPESTAYVRVLLGDLELQRNRTGAARAEYTAALRTLPGYPAALVGLARADAAGGELGGAAARLRRAANRLPLTSTLTLLAEVEDALGNEAPASAALAAARAQQGLLPREASAGEADAAGADTGATGVGEADAAGADTGAPGAGAAGAAVLPDAEAVVFAADHGSASAAVRLGRRVWRRAPSVRSADALGWALTRSGRPWAGYAFARRALRLGSRDPLLRLHAGMAAREAGLAAPATRHLAVAAAGRAALPPQGRDVLRETLR
jgi:tetratricopeptide (TPR) repeat protein